MSGIATAIPPLPDGRTFKGPPPTDDSFRLAFVISRFVNIPPGDVATHDITRALVHDSVFTFFTDFVPMGKSAIMNLKIPAVAPGTPDPTDTDLPRHYKSTLHAIVSFFHHICVEHGQQVDPLYYTKDEFDDYRISEYVPDHDLVPWKLTLKKRNESKETEWRKHIKPNITDYPIIKDETKSLKWKEEFVATIKAHGLEHHLDETYVVNSKDRTLYDQQETWLFKVFQRSMQTAKTKTIVNSYTDKQDTPEMWKKIMELHTKSTAADISASKISTYITSVKIDKNWRGTQTNFILHYKEQVRQLFDITDSSEHFTDGQLVRFLNQAVSGVENLATVYQTNKNARVASGVTTKILYVDYVQLLLEAAATHDEGRSGNNNFRRSANMMEFDDSPSDGHDHDGVLEACVHDVDTSVDELLVMNNDIHHPDKPRHIRMDRKTWKSLNPVDQKAWDTVSDDGKQKILSYAAGKANKKPNRNGSYSANHHDYIFDDDAVNGNSNADSPIEYQTNTHEATANMNDTSRPKNDATGKDSPGKDNSGNRVTFKPGPHTDGVDVNMMLSSSSGNKSSNNLLVNPTSTGIGESSTPKSTIRKSSTMTRWKLSRTIRWTLLKMTMFQTNLIQIETTRQP